jgi:cyclopropane fatty-acyl-phospholipid synthase-like methyltransferase
MPHLLSTLIDKHLGAELWPRLRQTFADFAQDFWQDGNENPLAGLQGKLGIQAGVAAKTVPPAVSSFSPAPPAAGTIWHATPGEISEKMWGDGMVTPGDEVLTDKLYTSLALSKEMSVLDLSAGLGARLRTIAEKTGATITGLEPDPAIAARGMAMSQKAGQGKHAPITPYDPLNFAMTRTFDCVIARETFYRVPDKAAFFKAIAGCLKPKGQVSFTDYIVDPENRNQAAMTVWYAFEKNTSPLGVVEMAEAWAKVGVDLRVSEDLSAFYKQEVAAGLKRLSTVLVSGPRPDAETKEALRRRLETWAHRMMAMSRGMKFYRFYGTRG